MEEVENQGSKLEEIASPVTEAKQEVVADAKVDKTTEAEPIQEEQDTHWIKRLRKDRDEAIRKSKMQEELLQQLLAQKAQVSPQAIQEEDIFSEIQKEEYVPGEKVVKAYRKIEEKFEKKLQEMEKKYQQKQYADTFSELKRDYPDLEEVVNPDTLAIVKETNPKLAEVWSRLDDYSIAVQAYPYIKNTGILDKLHGSKRSKEVDKKIEQNKKTVASPQVYDKRPIAQAFSYNNLSDSQKEELQKEMYRYGQLAGGGY